MDMSSVSNLPTSPHKPVLVAYFQINITPLSFASSAQIPTIDLLNGLYGKMPSHEYQVKQNEMS